MATLAEAAPCRARDVSLLGVHGNDVALRLGDEEIELSAGRLAAARLDDHGRLQKRRRGQEPDRIFRLYIAIALLEQLAFLPGGDSEAQAAARQRIRTLAEDHIHLLNVDWGMA